MIKRVEGARLRLEGRSGRWPYQFRGREDGTVLWVYPSAGYARAVERVPILYYSGDPSAREAPRSYLGWRGGFADSLRRAGAQLVTYRVEDFVRFCRMGGVSDLDIWERTTWNRESGEFDPWEMGALRSRGRSFVDVLRLAWHNPDMFKAEGERCRRSFARVD